MFLPILETITVDPFCTPSAAFFGMMGAAIAIVFCNLGSAYGTSKAGVGVAHLGVMDSKLLVRGIIPCIMAGIFGIYGLIVAAVIGSSVDMSSRQYSNYKGYSHLASGLAVGLSSLAAGMSIGVCGDAGVRAFAKQQRVFVGLILLMIFAEALGLYGFIVSLLLISLNKAPQCRN